MGSDHTDGCYICPTCGQHVKFSQAQQHPCQVKSMEREPIYSQLAAIAPTIIGHESHRWRQVGRCVYCECGSRLYQGTIPTDHPVAPDPPRTAKNDPATAMLERWGK